MRITIETTEPQDQYSHKVVREVYGDDLKAIELIRVIREALLGFGYSKETVDEALGEAGL